MLCVCSSKEEEEADVEEDIAEARAKFLSLTEELGATEGEKAFDLWRLKRLIGE